MFKASPGGGVAAPTSLYRHALVRLIIPLLGPLDARRGWCPLVLALAAILMSLDAAPTLAQRFESALGVLDRALPRRRRTGRTYQGFVKALTHRSDRLTDALTRRLRTLTIDAAGRDLRIGRWTPIGVDGSKFDAPRTIANEALGLAGKDKCGPQMVLLFLVHLGAMLPWGWAIGGARDSERALLGRVLDDLPAGTLLVADAGFTGYEFLSALQARGVSFLVRVGRGVRLLRELGCYAREGRHTVYLWPDSHRDRPPLRLRLVRVGSVYLVTDVTDPRALSARAASELYRRRWGLELTFRALKQTLERRTVRSCAPARARLELAWSVLGLWMLMLLGARAIRAAGHGPRRLSVAATLATVRRALHGDMSGARLGRRLRRCTLEPGRGPTRKAAYRWPHKKNPLPPGPPIIATATRAQVALARSVAARSAAA